MTKNSNSLHKNRLFLGALLTEVLLQLFFEQPLWVPSHKYGKDVHNITLDARVIRAKTHSDAQIGWSQTELLLLLVPKPLHLAFRGKVTVSSIHFDTFRWVSNKSRCKSRKEAARCFDQNQSVMFHTCDRILIRPLLTHNSKMMALKMACGPTNFDKSPAAL